MKISHLFLKFVEAVVVDDSRRGLALACLLTSPCLKGGPSRFVLTEWASRRTDGWAGLVPLASRQMSKWVEPPTGQASKLVGGLGG